MNPKVSTDAIAEMKIFDLSEVDREPRPLVRIPPQYPPKLLLNRVSGRVDLLIVIDEEGRVTDYQVRRFTHNEFKREVTRVIRQWKFSPAMKDGRKVAVRKVQPFYFGKQR
ncbi:MAG: energy transducer TonB [Verrucomicrobia bacterium]|nr:energy transducer TonB [Verrucomicrobiota bacterium]MBT6104286.1 energy transducer TonB [Verrucomicrobiota bacterium]MBT7026617.1 energy transducer TonB [Verrucomicrobiota bacterium]